MTTTKTTNPSSGAMRAEDTVAGWDEMVKNNHREIDRRGMKRVVPMKCLALGHSKTGTMSLRAALLKLGLRDCYHMASTFENPSDCILWKEAFDARYHGIGKPYTREDFDQILGHCMATTDAPASYLSLELIQAYPEAKVILTSRDIDAWHKSMKKTIVDPFMRGYLAWMLSYVDAHFFGRWMPMAISVFFGAFGTAEDFDRDGKELYEKHNNKIRAAVPKERLLEYRVGEGWERLCNFLEVPVPDEPFPRVNEGAQMQEQVQRAMMYSLKKGMLSARGAATVGLLILVIVPLWQAWRLLLSGFKSVIV